MMELIMVASGERWDSLSVMFIGPVSKTVREKKRKESGRNKCLFGCFFFLAHSW